MPRLDGKVALITGGASGIGRAMATAFAVEGATVVTADLDGADVRADVSVERDVEAMIAHVVEAHGRLDVLCNNAGINGEMGPLHESDVEAFDRVQAVNVRGVFLGTKFGVRAMLAGGGGVIINTASVAGLGGFPDSSAYVASKHGVVGLTRATAVEYATRGIRANALCPGLTKTPMLAAIRDQGNASMADPRFMPPLGRLAEADEIAQAAVFLASDESAYLSGVALPIDGGYAAI